MLYQLLDEANRLKHGVVKTKLGNVYARRRTDFIQRNLVVVMALIQHSDRKSDEILLCRDQHKAPVYRDHKSILRYIRDTLGVVMCRATYYNHIKFLLRTGLLISRRRYHKNGDHFFARVSEKRLGKRLLALLGINAARRQQAKKSRAMDQAIKEREIQSQKQAQKQLNARQAAKQDPLTASLDSLMKSVKMRR